jgi:hypothetical protein
MVLRVSINICTRTHMYAVERPVERVKMVTRVTTHEQPIVQNVRQPVQIVIEVHMFTHTTTHKQGYLCAKTAKRVRKAPIWLWHTINDAPIWHTIWHTINRFSGLTLTCACTKAPVKGLWSITQTKLNERKHTGAV